MHGYFLRKIQFGLQTFWGKQGIKSTIHKLLLNLLQKEILISGLTEHLERRQNSDANYIFSLRLKYTLLDHWPKHVNIRTFFVFRGPQNAGKSRNQFHVDIVQSLSAVAFKICKHNVFHEICHSKMLLFVAVHSKHIYPALLFAFHSKHI